MDEIKSGDKDEIYGKPKKNKKKEKDPKVINIKKNKGKKKDKRKIEFHETVTKGKIITQPTMKSYGSVSKLKSIRVTGDGGFQRITNNDGNDNYFGTVSMRSVVSDALLVRRQKNLTQMTARAAFLKAKGARKNNLEPNNPMGTVKGKESEYYIDYGTDPDRAPDPERAELEYKSAEVEEEGYCRLKIWNYDLMNQNKKMMKYYHIWRLKR